MRIFGHVFGKAAGPVSFADYLGRGWYWVESDARNTWVWSLDQPELRIPPGAEKVVLRFTTIYRRLTGRPQRVRVRLDGELHREIMVRRTVNKLVIPCAGKRLLSMEVETIRPCDYPGQTETRGLGICLAAYETVGQLRPEEAPAITSRRPEIEPNGPPQTLQVELTTACHLKCKMCMRTVVGRGESPHMTEEVWTRIAEAAAQGVENVHILGSGEPFLHPRFTRYLRELDEHGVAVSFSTSGDQVDEKKAAELRPLEHFSTISISIDSPDPAIYQGIRGQALARAEAGLDRLMGAVRHPDRVRVVAVVMKHNMESLLGFPAMLTRHGVTQLVLRGVIDYKGVVPEEVPEYNAPQLATLRRIKAECEQAGITVSLLPSIPVELITIGSGEFLPEQPAQPCACDGEPTPAQAEAAQPGTPLTRLCCAPWEFAMVTRAGDVFPCDASHLQARIGSLAGQPFAEIWRGEGFRQFRRQLLEGSSVACANCPRRFSGEHPLNLYAAELVESESRLHGPGPLRLVARNIGHRTWVAGAGPVIGTSRRKDRMDSAFFHPSWLQRNRVGTFAEARVEPGERATFTFEVNPAGTAGQEEHFQLVTEGQAWLPNTFFTVRAN